MKCENCGEEHDGSYGSGRFCSLHCRKSFIAKKCKKYPTKQELVARGFGAKPKSDGWICDKCKEKFSTRAQLRLHLKIHPNNQGWAKGLTKETNIRIAKTAEKISKALKDGYNSGRLKFSDEHKKKLSENKKQYYKKYPDAHPNKKLCKNRNHMTYPEQVVMNWLIANNIQFEQQYKYEYIAEDGKIHNRYVDFFIPSKNLFIEVDGQYWHPAGNIIDFLKDKYAVEHNFKTLRINPAKKIENILNNELK